MTAGRKRRAWRAVLWAGAGAAVIAAAGWAAARRKNAGGEGDPG